MSPVGDNAAILGMFVIFGRADILICSLMEGSSSLTFRLLNQY